MGLFLLPAILGDVHDFVLEDKKIGRAFARQADHVLIVVFDPAFDRLAIHKLDRNWFLLVSQHLEERCFFERVFWRWNPAAFAGIRIALRSTERHAGILHKRAWLTGNACKTT